MSGEFALERYDAAVFDVDGTVWLSETAMPGAAAFLERCREHGMAVAFATNATAYPVERLRELLAAVGLWREGDAVVTGGTVVAHALAARDIRHVVAEVPAAMRAAIEALGVRVSATSDFDPALWATLDPHRAVVMGASQGATFGSVERIGHLASLGHPLYVTSKEPGYPALGRMEPGGGMLVAALQALYDVEPIVLGKPSITYADVVRGALPSGARIVMFGDSQRADMGIAELLGADGVLVTPAGVVRADLTQPQFVTIGLDAEIRPFAGAPA